MKNMEYRICNAKHGFGLLNKLAEQGWNLSTATASMHGLKLLEAGDIVIEREKIDPTTTPTHRMMDFVW